MHLRKLVLACGFASFALSNYASALGLGEVKLKSTLNQPLSAEVQLLDTKGLTSEQIIVALASSGEFERNGLDFVHFYSEFSFEVALDNPGGPVVRITSRNPVREPYLNFLVEAKWTSGRLLREYTLLMDLPTFDEAVPQAVQAAQTSQSKSTAAKTKKADAAIEAEVQAAVDAANAETKPDIIAEQDQPAKKSKVAAGTYGPVGGRDTLWDIALAVRPDSSASVHQTMLALQRLNPEAFIRGNINLLKKGQVLRVPDAGEITSVPKSEAVRQFNTQTAEWSGTSGSTGLGAQLDASRRTTTESVKSEAVEGRVKLEAPSSKDKAANGQGSGANKGSGKALESELAATLEELDKAKSEKTELSSRVHDLEDQVKTMQRLVDVSNEKLRALQLNATQPPEQAAVTVPAPVSTDAPVGSKDVAPAAVVESNAGQVASSVAAATEAASSVAASVAPKKPVAKPVPKVAPEKSIVDHISDNILWVGLGAAALLAAAGVVVMRRRKSQAEETKNYDDSENLFAPEPNFDAFNQPNEEDLAVDASADEMSLFDEEDTTAVAETGDVVGEADIYIAYGKFDQAEEMLVNGLAKDPASSDIRLKLLEVYSQTQNIVEFDKHYAAILPLATGFALSRAKELRANIPGASEFSAEAVAHNEESFDFNEDFNLDDLDSSPRETATHSSNDDLSFDLDLDDASDLVAEDLDASTTNYGMNFSEKVSLDKGKVASVDNDFILDFDLDGSRSKHADSAAEDLSEISLALDDLDDDGLPEDINVPEREDEFSFDFNDLDNEPSSLAQEVDSIKSSELNEDDTVGDDFNLEMDVNNLDLAALDNEMASFDADLDKLDDDLPTASVASLESEEITIGSLDDELADLDLELDDEGLDNLDDADFSWEEPEVARVESVSETIVDEFALEDDDDFDIDSPLGLDADADLHDLDAQLAGSSLDNELALDDEPEIDLDELDVELDEKAFSELDDELNRDLSAEESTLSLENDSDLAELADESLDAELAEEETADDDLFEEALSDFSAESLAMDDASDMSEDDMDAELDFMADADEAATKLDLARAYIDMGDSEGARDILAEVAHEGNEQQRQEAVDLLSRIEA